VFQRKNVPGYFPGIGVGYLGMGRHMPRPAAMDALFYGGRKNRNRLPSACVRSRNVGICGACPRLTVSVADITLIFMHQDLRILCSGSAGERHRDES